MGVLIAPLPGLGVVPGLAVGMAAALTSALRLPVSSVVLVVLLLDSAAMVPVIILASVVAFVTTQLLPPGRAVPAVGKPAEPSTAQSPAVGKADSDAG